MQIRKKHEIIKIVKNKGFWCKFKNEPSLNCQFKMATIAVKSYTDETFLLQILRTHKMLLHWARIRKVEDEY